MNRFFHFLEAPFIFMVINWQPIVGAISGVIAGVYYLSMLKVNVINPFHEGSWIKYIKSIFSNFLK